MSLFCLLSQVCIEALKNLTNSDSIGIHLMYQDEVLCTMIRIQVFLRALLW